MNDNYILFSNILTLNYDNDKYLLEVGFRSGDRHRYKNVPSTIYFSLLNAYSMDTYFDKYVRSIFEVDLTGATTPETT